MLGVFAFGLLLSFLLVSNRKEIPLSPPVKAQFDGLDISMPSGRGWRTHDKWIFSKPEDAFALISVLKDSSRAIATVNWKYYMTPRQKAVERIISEKVNEEGFINVRTGKTRAADLDFTVMVFASPVQDCPEGVEDYYYAVCRLPIGRLLTLEVRTLGDAELARRAFQACLKGIKYTTDWPPPDKNSVVRKTTETKAGWAMPMPTNIRKDS